MSRPTVLVVEDNPITLKMVRMALEAEGYRVLEASTGAQALEQLGHRPDLVLQDLGLSDMDGFELAARIRQRPEGRDLPLVAFTGLLPAADKIRAGAVGFTDVLVKPLEASRLVQALAAWLASGRMAISTIGRGRRLVVVDDDPIQLKLARIRLEEAGFVVETAASGVAALEKARTSPPAAIVTDVLMPELDGFRVAWLARTDSRTAHVPIVLVTSHYVEESDEQLARRMGASGFALRSPSFDRVIEAVTQALEVPLPPAPTKEDPQLETDYRHRVAHQLERQVGLNAGLWERLVAMSSSLSVLSGISRALADRQDTEGALTESLNSCLDAAGLSKGALHVAEDNGSLRLAAQSGLGALAQASSATFFAPEALLARVSESGQPLPLPSSHADAVGGAGFLERLGARSALVVPIHARGERLGVLTLGSHSSSLAEQEWLPLVSAVATQLALAIALARAFRSRESALEALQLRERAIEALPDGLVITDARTPGYPVTYVNPGFERMTGYSSAEVLGRTCAFLQADKSDPDAARLLEESLREGRSVHTEIESTRKDGTRFWNSLELTPIRDAGSHLSHFVALMRDVTERRRLEDQLRQAQKMEAVGQLAGGVAHDFNNLLGVITGYGQLLLNELGARHPGRRRVELVLRAAERAADLTRQLLAFGRKQILQPRVIELDRVAGEVEPMLRRLLGEHIQLVSRRPQAPLCVKADPGQMEQIVMNLALNARDAMPGGGRLTIETREVQLGEEDLADRPGASAGAYVELSVRDEGSGMTPEVRSHIFEPFFTTKEPGRGTGLGLATVYGIVKQSEGHITVESEPGKGSRFAVYLRRVEPEAPSAAIAERALRSRRGQETVLLVEDDDALRDLTVEVLQRAGYRVYACRRPSEALAHGADDGEVHLLLLDVVLPEMSGPELAARLLKKHRGARALFISGYATESVAHHLQAGTPYLKKPYRPEELLERLEGILKS